MQKNTYLVVTSEILTLNQATGFVKTKLTLKEMQLKI